MPGHVVESEMPFEEDAGPVLPPGADEVLPLSQAGDPPAREQDQAPEQLR